jgi:predicted nucleotidyltransferase component of viral defense system
MEAQGQCPTGDNKERRILIDDVFLRRIATEERVPLGTIEKDFAISCALLVMSRSELKDNLIFKGGTAIKKIYRPEARFSEDMDFTVRSIGEEEAITSLKELFNEIRVDSISFERSYEERFSQSGRRLRLPFTGPLQYRNSIRVDLSFRDDMILDVKEHPVIPIYGDSISSSVYAIEFVEIMAEKLRALIDRGYPRDYYDVYFHMDEIRDKEFLKELTIRKCNLIGISNKPSNIFNEEVLKRIESAWKTQLEHLLSHYVDFGTVITELKSKLSFLYTEID